MRSTSLYSASKRVKTPMIDRSKLQSRITSNTSSPSSALAVRVIFAAVVSGSPCGAGPALQRLADSWHVGHDRYRRAATGASSWATASTELPPVMNYPSDRAGSSRRRDCRSSLLFKLPLHVVALFVHLPRRLMGSPRHKPACDEPPLFKSHGGSRRMVSIRNTEDLGNRANRPCRCRH